jgi:hypothetical protein
MSSLYHVCYLFHYCELRQRGAGAEGSNVVRGKETGGQAQFDWMLDYDSSKAQPIGLHLVSLY